MKNGKYLEIKSVDVMSAFKYFGGIFFISGVILGLFSNILRIDLPSIEMVRIFPFLAGMKPGVIAGIILGLIYGISAGIGFSIFALLYNFFAALFGGIKIFLAKEKSES